MLPLKKGTTVIIDPTIASDNLMFGPIAKKYYKMMGTILCLEYMAARKCNTYRVKFPNDQEFWFKEGELV